MGDFKLESEFVRVAITDQVFSTDRVIESRCNLIYFKNQGDTVATLNGKRVLQSGEDWSFGCNAGEWFDLPFSIVFSGVGTNSLYVLWKNP